MFFFSSRRRHTRWPRDWSSDVCSSDLIELRARNEPELDPDTGLPFNQRRLLDCLREGAERFGWAERDPRPRSHHQDGWLIGTGVASATYPAFRQPGSKALIRSRSEERRVGKEWISTR